MFFHFYTFKIESYFLLPLESRPLLPLSSSMSFCSRLPTFLMSPKSSLKPSSNHVLLSLRNLPLLAPASCPLLPQQLIATQWFPTVTAPHRPCYKNNWDLEQAVPNQPPLELLSPHLMKLTSIRQLSRTNCGLMVPATATGSPYYPVPALPISTTWKTPLYSSGLLGAGWGGERNDARGDHCL